MFRLLISLTNIRSLTFGAFVVWLIVLGLFGLAILRAAARESMLSTGQLYNERDSRRGNIAVGLAITMGLLFVYRYYAG
jgi:hypothetical protein